MDFWQAFSTQWIFGILREDFDLDHFTVFSIKEKLLVQSLGKHL